MSSDYSSSEDSDAELQEQFAKGILKCGLNIPVTQEKGKVFINNVSGLKQKLTEFKNNLPWIETLDMVNKLAPLAPELAVEMDVQGGQHSDSKQVDGLNEFKRESLFYRQAQSAVLEGLARLKAMNIPTKRPDDYFAEMAKSDAHMQKVQTALVKRQAETENREKIRKFRQQRKLQKQLQKEGKLKKQSEKKAVLDEVKKFRKGVRKDLDFLEDSKRKFNGKKLNQQSVQSQLKRRYKDAKFGYGGKKRGLKANTHESSADTVHSKQPNRGGQKNRRLGNTVHNKQSNRGGQKNNRLGKSRRNNMIKRR